MDILCKFSVCVDEMKAINILNETNGIYSALTGEISSEGKKSHSFLLPSHTTRQTTLNMTAKLLSAVGAVCELVPDESKIHQQTLYVVFSLLLSDDFFRLFFFVSFKIYNIISPDSI